MISSQHMSNTPITTTTGKKVLVSGIKSTGRPHIGNYFGAMKQYVEMQHEYDTRIFIADLHSLTSVQNGSELAQATLDLAIDYIAIGLDPEKVTIFKQSDLPEVTELGWIFNCITTMPYLMRAHSFKDAEAKNKEINVGVFDYPMLMAADILIHNADIVPVGKDQKQHVEFARDTAEKFNRIFRGDGKSCEPENALFKLPDVHIIESVETVPGIDGQKMSKSYNNHIPLFSTDEELKKLVMSIVTDSNGGKPMNVYNMHKLFRDETYLEKLYTKNEGKYKILKEALLEDMIAFIKPLREKREQIAKDPDKVRNILARNGALMREKTHALMYEVRKATGLIV
ncbi:MAG: tryptophan--tRNA ligase [Candidatus Taylorbacteria bacterium]|nr:tryptophan--tRNA ligase [Candidatus Taylorbacteria bacterium]